MRRLLISANWKMNHLRSDALGYAQALVESARDRPFGVEAVVFPPFPLLVPLAEALGTEGEAVAAVGGQDLHPRPSGAHTGDVSGVMLADAGCRWALCGHSERRRDHHESSALVGEKLAAATEAGLAPMLCIGETLEEREAGSTEAVLSAQLEILPESPPPGLAIAYEPVWAIGTGRTATPEQAQSAHLFVRTQIAERWGSSTAEETRILYGGSAKPENCQGLIVHPDIDGFLIGGAGLDPISFLDIIRRCDPSRSS